MHLGHTLQVFYYAGQSTELVSVVQGWSEISLLSVHIFPSVWSSKSLYLSILSHPISFSLLSLVYLILWLILAELLLLCSWCFAWGSTNWSSCSLHSALIPFLAHLLLSLDRLQHCGHSFFAKGPALSQPSLAWTLVNIVINIQVRASVQFVQYARNLQQTHSSL